MVLRLGLQITKDVGDTVVEVDSSEGRGTADLVITVGSDSAVTAKGELGSIIEIATALVKEAGLGNLGSTKREDEALEGSEGEDVNHGDW